MEDKNQLLEKLGYSKQYLEALQDDNVQSVFEQNYSDTVLFQSDVIDTAMTTLVIEKTAKPINSRLIFNER